MSIILGTSVTGATQFVIGIAAYTGQLPTLFKLTDSKHGGLTEVGYLYLFYQLLVTVMTIIGFVFQTKRLFALPRIRKMFNNKQMGMKDKRSNSCTFNLDD